MSKESKILEKLLEREAELKQQIKDAKKAQAKKEAAAFAQKCRIIGAAVLAEMDINEAFKNTIQPIIDRQTKDKKHRQILGLQSLQDNTPEVEPNNQTDQANNVFKSGS